MKTHEKMFKKHQKMMRRGILITIIASVFAISCEKNEIVNLNQHTKTAVANIPYYDNLYSVYAYLHTISQFDSIEDYFSFESRTGRQSLGRIADEFYNQIDFDMFSSEAALNSFLSSNSMFLDLEISTNGDTTILPRLYDHPFRYLADRNGMFQIEDTVIKILKDLVIFTNQENYEQLLHINETNLSTLANYPNLHSYTLNSKSIFPFLWETWWNFYVNNILFGEHSSCVAITPDHGVSSPYKYSTDGKWRMQAKMIASILPISMDYDAIGNYQPTLVGEIASYEIIILNEKKNKQGRWHLKKEPTSGSIHAHFHQENHSQHTWESTSLNKNLNSAKGKPIRCLISSEEMVPALIEHSDFHLTTLRIDLHNNVIPSFSWEL